MSDEPMREGDVFRWDYIKVPDSHSPYWCKARLAEFKNGKLWDLYWHGSYAGTCLGTEKHARKNFKLDFAANRNDLVAANPGVVEDYQSKDIVDLQHANGGKLYLRKGARRNAEVQRATLIAKRDAAQRKADGYQRMLDDKRFWEALENWPPA